MSTPLVDIGKMLDARPEIVIVMHRGPDGDAIGSSLALHHILKAMNIQSTVVAPDAYPNFLHWLPGNEGVIVFESQKEAAAKALEECQLVFCLDFNAPSRMGDLEQTVIDAQKPIIVVDHHRDPAPFAEAYFVDDTASSTAEMIYRLAEGLQLTAHVTPEAAMCLYTGLVTDTGSFRFPSVTPAVMRIAAKLLETGIDHSKIYQAIFDSRSEDQMRLWGYAISEKLVVLRELSTAYISLSQKELQRFNFRKGDTEGLVNEGLGIQGIRFAAFFAEKDGLIKISFRSQGNFDVNVFARKYFEGGGHVNAAGGRFKGSLEGALAIFNDALKAETTTILSAI